MNILNSPKLIRQKLSDLLSQCEKMHFAVAWATHHHEFFKELVEHQDKIEAGYVGLHFFQTSPEFIEQFADHGSVHFVDSSKKGVFHPKVYVFDLGSLYAVVLGSANMTNGALTTNDELCLNWYANKDDKAVQELIDTIESYSELNLVEVDDEWLELYTEKAKAYKRAVKKIQDADSTDSAQKILADLNVSIEWGKFSDIIKLNRNLNGLDERIELLDHCQDLLAHQSLSDMNYTDRRLIAGLSDIEATMNSGWFGSLNPSGVAKQIIKDYPEVFSRPLDEIPLTGEITKQRFDRFIQVFEKEFSKYTFARTPTIFTLTRFLCIKRPDFFVSINHKNFTQLAEALDFNHKPSVEGYWDLLQLIHQQPWYTTQLDENHPDYALWKYRVAMLDAIYYEQ